MASIPLAKIRSGIKERAANGDPRAKVQAWIDSLTTVPSQADGIAKAMDQAFGDTPAGRTVQPDKPSGSKKTTKKSSKAKKPEPEPEAEEPKAPTKRAWHRVIEIICDDETVTPEQVLETVLGEGFQQTKDSAAGTIRGVRHALEHLRATDKLK